jgi:hypothetical protein
MLLSSEKVLLNASQKHPLQSCSEWHEHRAIFRKVSGIRLFLNQLRKHENMFL